MLRKIGSLFKETFAAWQADKASRLAAALAYYAVFSLAPLLILAIALTGLIFGDEAAQNQVAEALDDAVGPEVAQVIQGAIANASEPSSGILASIIGLGALLLGASGFFGALQDALNTIWDVTPETGGGIKGLIKNRLLQFLMVLLLGFLLLLSLVASVVVSAVINFLQLGSFLQYINLIVSFALITLLFALVYKVLPDIEISWRDVWVGAAVTSLLFTIGKLLIGLYLGSSAVGSAYGAAGSLIVLLVWIYYSAQVFLMGAEFTKVYTQQFGSREEEARLYPA
jgi:membrane protein